MAIKEEIKQILQTREQNKLKRAEQATIRKEHLFEQLHQTGNLWKSPPDMDNYLRGKSKTKCLQAVKTQINVRHKILKQLLGRKFLFPFSYAKKSLTLDELKAILLNLMWIDFAHTSTCNNIAIEPCSKLGR